MNAYLESIILGIVQGITEFLPISSDGHLELSKWLLGDTHSASDSFMMTIILHFGTMFAIIWVFRKMILDIIKNLNTPEGRKFVMLVIISMIPAVIVGLALESIMESFFSGKIVFVGLMLVINGVLLLSSDYFPPSSKPITPMKSLLIGIAQAIAILPGISRSGSTITTSLALGIDRKQAANFSFLIVVPLLLGKMAKDILGGDLVMSQEKAMPLVVGFICSLIVGIFACQLILKVVQRGKLGYFGIYCIVIGLAAIVVKLWIYKS
jgi:undecaprenyl-diphosphatase